MPFSTNIIFIFQNYVKPENYSRLRFSATVDLSEFCRRRIFRPAFAAARRTARNGKPAQFQPRAAGGENRGGGNNQKNQNCLPIEHLRV